MNPETEIGKWFEKALRSSAYTFTPAKVFTQHPQQGSKSHYHEVKAYWKQGGVKYNHQHFKADLAWHAQPHQVQNPSPRVSSALSSVAGISPQAPKLPTPPKM